MFSCSLIHTVYIKFSQILQHLNTIVLIPVVNSIFIMYLGIFISFSYFIVIFYVYFMFVFVFIYTYGFLYLLFVFYFKSYF